MIRITKQTDYGLVLLTAMARQGDDEPQTARDLAERCSLPVPMVSQILKCLSRERLLESTRGAKGGYRLVREPQKISVAEVIAALEGPIAITECSVDGLGDCEQEAGCPLQGPWQKINRVIRGALESVHLTDLIGPGALPHGDDALVPAPRPSESKRTGTELL
ncbi:MAG: SUF system Fe-S cluster assembly regulator [Planctomycetota bacterium]